MLKKIQVPKDKYKHSLSLESLYFVVFVNHFDYPLLLNNFWLNKLFCVKKYLFRVT